MLDILAIGEPLMEFSELPGAEGVQGSVYLKGFGGDISNMAVAAARQGARVGLFTALGDDQFQAISRYGTRRIGHERDPARWRRTGVYFIGCGGEGTSSAISVRVRQRAFGPADPLAASRLRAFSLSPHQPGRLGVARTLASPPSAMAQSRPPAMTNLRLTVVTGPRPRRHSLRCNPV